MRVPVSQTCSLTLDFFSFLSIVILLDGKWHLVVALICIFLVNDTEKAMAPHSSTLAWKIPWMEEPGRLQSMGSLRVGHD